MKKFAAGLIAVAMSVTMLAGCGVPANTVHSVDDLEARLSVFSLEQQAISMPRTLRTLR